MDCAHESREKDWVKAQNGVIKLHPYCNKCGTLKNVSSDRGKKIGYFVKTLSKIRKNLRAAGYRVSDAQVRLIMKELSEIDGFDDIWWITFTKQKEIFIRVVKEYINVSKEFLEEVV